MYSEIVVLLVIAVVAGILLLRLRQSLILGFIAVGILAGPAGFNLIHSTPDIHVFAEMGLTLLLFVVGLKLDLHIIRTLGPIALIAGLGQVLLTLVGGAALCLVLGLSPSAALFIAVALTFSSTIIVVKLLSDKRETESLYGQIALGILLVQDLLVVAAMIALTALGQETAASPWVSAGAIALKGIGLLAGVAVMSFVVFPPLLRFICASTELLVLFALAWALALAYGADLLGFSKEVGAFLAGVALASTSVRDLLGAKLVSLRDFLLLFFFLELGSRLDLGGLGGQLLYAVPLSLFVLVGKPLLILQLMGWMGYRRRTGFMTGVSLAQISEFSLIFIALAAATGRVAGSAVSLVTLVGLVTIGLSTYLITQTSRLYEWLSPYLRVFERAAPAREQLPAALTRAGKRDAILLVGLGRYGTQVGAALQARGRQVLGVDFDPQAIRRWQARGGHAVFGDAADPDFAVTLPLGAVRWVVSSLRDVRLNRAIGDAARRAGFLGHFAVTAADHVDAERARRARPDLIFIPFEDAAEQAVDLLTSAEEQIARAAMDRQIEAIHDHYIICGFGRMGQQIAKDLAAHRVPFVVVEWNPEQLPRLHERNLPHVVGRASEDETLLRAGITRACGLIAVAASDEENVFIVLTARVLNPHLYIVARSILEENEDKLLRAGADRVMSPYILGGRRMAAAVTRPGVVDLLDLLLHDDGDLEVEHYTIASEAPVIGQALQAIHLWEQCGVTTLAVRRAPQGLHPNPSPDFVLQAGDEIVLMGTRAQLDAAVRCLGVEGGAAAPAS